jgi:hypothetical protein
VAGKNRQDAKVAKEEELLEPEFSSNRFYSLFGALGV